MKTRMQIDFDYFEALGKAAQIRTVADNLNSLSKTDFENTMNDLAFSWIGANADSYREKGEMLQSKMNGTVTALHGIAEDIVRIAETIRNAELAALEIAESRIY